MAIEHKRVIDIETKNAQTGVRNLKQEIKELRTAMANMEKGTEEWENASTRLANAMQKQREISEAAKYANKDFGAVMSNLAGVSAGVVAGVNGITSALSLLGVEVEKDDIGMIKFTQSMSAIVQALSTVDTATKAWKGLMTSLNAMLDQKIADTAATEANTVATEANTVASTKNAAAKKGQAAAAGKNATAMTAEGTAAAGASKGVGGLSGAFTKLAAALKISKAALGIIGIAIAAVTAALTYLIKKQQEEKAIQREINQLSKDTKTAMAEASGEYDTYNRILHDSNEAYETRLGALNELKNAFPGYEAQLTKEGQLIKDNNAFLEANIELLKNRAAFQVVKDSYIEKLKKINELEEENKQIMEGTDKNWLQDAFGPSGTFGILDVFFDSWVADNRISDRTEEINRLKKQLPSLSDEMEKYLKLMGTYGVAAKTNFKDLNNQILQTKANIESTARSLQVLLSNYLSETKKFENNNVETVFQKFVNTVENAMTAAGKTSGEVFGDGIWDGIKKSLHDSPDVFERFGKLLTANIQVALDNAVDPEDFFSKLQESLTDVNNAFDDDILNEWLASINEIVIDGEKITRKGFFNGTYLDNLRKQLDKVIAKYNQLAGSNAIMSTATGEKYAQVINEWNRNYAEIYKQHQEYVTKSNTLQSRYVELISQAGREMARGEEENYRKTMEIANAAWDESQSLIEADRNLRKSNEQTFQIMDKKYQAFVDATAALDKYNLQLATTNDELTRLGLKKDALERQITMVQEIMRAYNELQTTANGQFKDVYDWYKKIVPEMTERIELERQYREELEAGNKDASFNKRMGELELEKRQLQERIDLTKQAIQAMEEQGGPDMAGVDMEKYRQYYEQMVKDMQALAENQIAVEEEMYQQRSNNLQLWLTDQEQRYSEAYSRLEQLMLENNDIWRLGSEDYNFEMEQLEAQRYFLEQKEAELESWREQDLINEIDYQEQLKAIREQYAEIDYNIQRESSNRKLKVHNTYFNALKSITNAISGIMSEVIEAEEENKEKQKQLRIAQTWMTGIMASIEALASGIRAPIPAPGNYILGGVLSAATIAETALAASNIQKEYGTQTSGAANINVPTYETLAYETNSEINGNIRDQRVYLVESEAMAMGQHIDTVESEAQF